MPTLKTVAVKAGVVLTVIFATGSLVGVVAKKLYDQKLSRAEANATAASQSAGRQIKAAHDSIADAQKLAKHAQSVVARVPADFQKVAVTAPDTCAAVVAAADTAISKLEHAFSEQEQATAAIQGALTATADTLQGMRDASDKLVNVIKHPSFLARLKPSVTVTVGPQVGVDTHGKAYAGGGVTFGLSWKL